MKTSIKNFSAILLLGAVMAGPAAAASSADIRADINQAIGSDSNVFTTIDDGVVTMTGYFSDAGVQAKALYAAEAADGVQRVIDLTSVSE